jgi:hypothetical protein
MTNDDSDEQTPRDDDRVSDSASLSRDGAERARRSRTLTDPGLGEDAARGRLTHL